MCSSDHSSIQLTDIDSLANSHTPPITRPLKQLLSHYITHSSTQSSNHMTIYWPLGQVAIWLTKQKTSPHSLSLHPVTDSATVSLAYSVTNLCIQKLYCHIHLTRPPTQSVTSPNIFTLTYLTTSSLSTTHSLPHSVINGVTTLRHINSPVHSLIECNKFIHPPLKSINYIRDNRNISVCLWQVQFRTDNDSLDKGGISIFSRHLLKRQFHLNPFIQKHRHDVSWDYSRQSADMSCSLSVDG